MAKNPNPLILIDDDTEDLELFHEALKLLNLKNKILLFSAGEDALAFLSVMKDPCFFILCDINMPKMNGLELREEINKDHKLRMKAIPFLFLSTSDKIEEVYNAFNNSIQGYFKKPVTFEGITEMFGSIVAYWDTSLQPL